MHVAGYEWITLRTWIIEERALGKTTPDAIEAWNLAFRDGTCRTKVKNGIQLMGIYRGEKNTTGQRDEIGDSVTRKRDVNDSNDVMDVSFAMPQTVARREGFLAAQTQHMLQGTQACNVPLPDCEHVNQHSLARPTLGHGMVGELRRDAAQADAVLGELQQLESQDDWEAMEANNLEKEILKQGGRPKRSKVERTSSVSSSLRDRIAVLADKKDADRKHLR